MIDYDSFSHCHLTDIFFAFHAGAKELKVNTRKSEVMLSGSEGELFKSNIDARGVCGKRGMANSVLGTKCGNWVHGRCAKIKRITARLAIHFACSKCKGIMEGAVGSIER